ncbi:cache domain-containing sensor histidine kinase [Kineothrix sp. MB12-C1]|uniref:cache domain-containing sensor histidine kinase n=1 Tax=Kineothrix sp. MB12-C1 TaxID=3070215 RepID=UPI0027D30B57|nr:histidine kinase [Kineothrix sp. MB12-C1]WMC92362.1 histidine kinase [Kineothrix sp. MB12-C1]
MERLLQEELSSQTIQNISKNESYIYEKLQSMAYYSSLFVNDEKLRERLTNESYSEYENMNYFNNLIDKNSILDLKSTFPMTKVVLFDNFGRVYSNWSMNYRNYDFLLEEEWVKKSREEKGHVTWSLFQPSYIEGEDDEIHISLARTILSEGTAGSPIGTIIVSINKKEFSEALMEYSNEGDFVYICIDKGEVLMDNDIENFLDKDEILRIYEETERNKKGKIQIKEGGNEYLISYYSLPKPWEFNGQIMKVFHFTDYNKIKDSISSITRSINMITVIILIIIVFVLFITSRYLVRPIKVLTSKMDQFSLKTPIEGIDLNRKDEIGKINRSFIHMGENINTLFEQLEEEHKIREQYQYESLRAQFNPHFIFNTLLNIRWMAQIRGANNIVECIEALGNLLSYSMMREKEVVTLDDEIKNIQSFIYIHNCRYPEFVTLTTHIDEELLNLKTVKFILQPIVENAVIHGYNNKEGEINVTIRAKADDEKLYIYVEDDGVGISARATREFERTKEQVTLTKMTGIGLANVDAFIRMKFGKEYGLVIERGEIQGTVVKYILPIISGGNDEVKEGIDSR